MSQAPSLTTTGLYVNGNIPGLPEALEGSVRAEITEQSLHVFMERTARGEKDAYEALETHHSRLLLDLDEIDPASLNLKVILRDLELLTAQFRENGEAVLGLFKDRENLDEAAAKAKELGFTEEAFVSQGGGAAFVLGALGLMLLLNSCAGPAAKKPYTSLSTHGPAVKLSGKIADALAQYKALEERMKMADGSLLLQLQKQHTALGLKIKQMQEEYNNLK